MKTRRHFLQSSTSLVALPALWLAWRVLAPATAPVTTPRARPRRRLEAASLCAGALLCVATSPPRDSRPPMEDPRPDFIPPTPESSVTVATRQAVAGHLELRCTDGARVEQPFAMEEEWRRHSWVTFSPAPAPGVECKITVLGAPGSYGPITAESRLVWCDVSPTSPLRCMPGQPGQRGTEIERAW